MNISIKVTNAAEKFCYHLSLKFFVLCSTFKAVPMPNMKAYGEKEESHHSFLS